MSVKAPSEKNFRRARVKPAKRKGGRAWISWRGVRAVVCGVLVVYAGYRAVDLVASASTLQVRRIAVRGNVRLSAGEVQALVDGLRGTNILTADLAAYRRRLLDSPWVADVALRRVLPSTVEVFVSERRPIGLCRLGNQLYLVDRQGMVIDEFGPKYAEFDLPIIDGLVRAPSAGEPALDPRRAELAARVIDAVAERTDLAQRLSQIDVAISTTPSCCSKGMPPSSTSGRSASSSGCSRTSSWRPPCGSGCRTSTTSICGSTRACTCGRWRRGNSRDGRHRS